MSEETKVQQVQEDLNDQMLVRRDKLAEYEADGVYPFGQRFVVNAPEEVVAAEKVKEKVYLEKKQVVVSRLNEIKSLRDES